MKEIDSILNKVESKMNEEEEQKKHTGGYLSTTNKLKMRLIHAFFRMN